MKIAVTGTRGIPRIQGGVETHCEELFPRLVQAGEEVTLFRRQSYVNKDNKITEYKGIQIIDLPTPRRKSFEAIVHTFRAIIRARKEGADIIHIHAIGPSLLIPFARLLGLKTVMTHHGADYERAKWGKTAKFMLRLGERWGAKHANEVIVISKQIQRSLARKYGRTDTHLIFNGVPSPKFISDDLKLLKMGLKPGKFVLALGRFVPEKNFHQLVEAFSKIDHKDFKLVIAGDADFPDEYSEKLKKLARENGVILPGFIKGDPLKLLLSSARLFVLPSSHEGLPISLLEAMSYHLDVLVSDIEANRLPQLSDSDFFQTGNVDALAEALSLKLQKQEVLPRTYDMSPYNWDCISRQTLEVYRRLAPQK